jgi:hypothetical protein
LIVDVGHGALGASLDATIEGTTARVASSGHLGTTFQWLTLSARWRFTWLERLSLDLGLGVRGSRLTATATGFSTNETATLYSLGPAVTASLWVRVLGPLQVVVRASTALRLPADQFVVAQGPTFSVGAWQAGVVAGLAVAWP